MIQKIIGSDVLKDAFTKINNNYNEQWTGATFAGNTFTITRLDGNTIDVVLPINSEKLILTTNGSINFGTIPNFNQVSVTPFDYIYSNSSYSVPTFSNFILADNLNSNDRIDIIVVNGSSNTVYVKQGTPSLTPTYPTIANDEVLVGAIRVKGNANNTNANQYILIYSAFLEQQLQTNINNIPKLSDLQDVNISSGVTSGDIIRWNGTAWVEYSPSFVLNADNGLNVQSGIAKLGGNLLADSVIDLSGSSLSFIDTVNNLNATGGTYVVFDEEPRVGYLSTTGQTEVHLKNATISDNQLSINWKTRKMYDTSGYFNVDWQSKKLLTLSGNSVDWANRALYDASDNVKYNWSNNSFYDNASIISADMNNRFLKDSSGNNSINWNSRTLIGSNGTTPLFTWGTSLSYVQSQVPLRFSAAGNGIEVPVAGSNAIAGVATLVGGTVTVNTTKVDANSIIMLTAQAGATAGNYYYRVSTRVNGASFTIVSNAPGDVSTIGWFIISRY